MAETVASDRLFDIRDQYLRSYREDPELINEHSRLEVQDKADYDGRFVFELLQNAADEMGDVAEPTVRFELTDEALIVANNGRELDWEDLDSLTRLTKTTKSGKSTIGNKGRGFISTINVTSNPQVYSDVVSVEFDAASTESWLEEQFEKEPPRNHPEFEPEGIPTLKIPFPRERLEFVRDLLGAESGSTEFNTVFVFPLREEGRIYEQIKERLLDLSRNTVALLPELESIELRIDEFDRTWSISRRRANNEFGKIVTVRRFENSEEIDESCFRLFERRNLNEVVAAQSHSLDEVLLEDIGELSVGVAFRIEDEDSTKLRPVFADAKEGEVEARSAPYLRVFLPTKERSPIPTLITGTFQSDTSRRNLTLEYSTERGYEGEFNALLLDQIAEVISEKVVPFVNQSETTAADFLECLDPTLQGTRTTSFSSGDVEDCLLQSLKRELRDEQFIERDTGDPVSEDDLLSIEEVTVPYTSTHDDTIGHDLAEILRKGTNSEGQFERKLNIPGNHCCNHATARVLLLYGAKGLEAEDVPRILERTESWVERREIHQEDYSGVIFEDPILNILVRIRKCLPDEECDPFDQACRDSAVFPIGKVSPNAGHAAEDSVERWNVERIHMGDRTLFFPSERSLAGLKSPLFEQLSADVYRGDLGRKGQTARKIVYTDDFRDKIEAIWDLDEPQFAELYTAVIRPYLPGADTETGDASPFQSINALKGIRELADVTEDYRQNSRDPEQPLIYQSSRRPFFNLCRLKVPVKSKESANGTDWVPAHNVHFGEEWQTQLGFSDVMIVENLFREVESSVSTVEFDPNFLAIPDFFGIEPSEDETELQKWYSFFRWLGVGEHVRPLPFFSLDPSTSHRYFDTESLSRPRRSAISPPEEIREYQQEGRTLDPRYAGLPSEQWEEYKNTFIDEFDSLVEEDDHRYIFQINPLEFYPELIEASTSNAEVSIQLLEHIGAWWDPRLSTYEHAKLAEFTNKQRRGSHRNKFFYKSEIHEIGSNLWLWQLRQTQWVATFVGTVLSQEAWLLSEDDTDQMRLSTDTGESIVLLPCVESPFLKQLIHERPSVQSLCDRLGIRTELVDGSFTAKDAKNTLQRLNNILRETAEVKDLHSVANDVEVIYTRIAELMPELTDSVPPTPQWDPTSNGLAELEVLCNCGGTYELTKASDAYFVRKQVERQWFEQLGIPLFVMVKTETPRFGFNLGITDARAEATATVHPGNELPITNSLEKPDHPYQDRRRLKLLLAGVLCRLQSDRGSSRLMEQDARNARRFYENVTFVEELKVELRIPQQSAGLQSVESRRGHYIQRENERKVDVYINSENSIEIPSTTESLARSISEFMDVESHYEAIHMLTSAAEDAVDVRQEILNRLDTVGAPASEQDLVTMQERVESGESTSTGGVVSSGGKESQEVAIEQANAYTATGIDKSEPDSSERSVNETRRSRSDKIPSADTLLRVGDRDVISFSQNEAKPSSETGTSTTSRDGGSAEVGGTHPGKSYTDKIDKFGMEVVKLSEQKRLSEQGIDTSETRVFDVSDPDKFAQARRDSKILTEAIDRFRSELDPPQEDPFAKDWPGFDLLTISEDEHGPFVDRCIELKSSSVNTRKPDLTWNEWKAAGGPLADRYYLYVARGIKRGNSGEASLLEIPKPFQTLRAHRQDRRVRDVQLDLYSFDLEDELIAERPIEWDE